ncbi:putative DUF2892 family protein [Corynebacterium mustelae]|uniref:Putative DUF2892 family protein n=1 Tax=Corynebacterium mustelae TaxID=571915 RepID=A0A0G3H5I6_9CORY|nr:DUF2892 domain-containing protein [Corynebacterium mustelae]AKK06417.1 putative DUF2892 family protein [Corynebacterium mustelae]
MTKNLSNQDRIIRVVASLLIGFGGMLASNAIFAIIMWILSVILLVTAIIGFCPIYKALGKSTCDIDPNNTTNP